MKDIPAKVDTLILGATYFGCGAAAAAGTGNALILERTVVTGRDFNLTFAPGSRWQETPLPPEVRELRDELIARRALVDGKILHAALAPVFAKWCRKRRLDILFSCDIMELGADHAVFHAVDGIHTVAFETLIDAEPSFSKHKYLTALVSAAPEVEISAVKTPDFELVPLLPESRAALVMELAPETEWPEARKLLRERWLRRPQELAGLRLMLSANEFFSGEYANPLAALAAGSEAAK